MICPAYTGAYPTGKCVKIPWFQENEVQFLPFTNNGRVIWPPCYHQSFIFLFSFGVGRTYFVCKNKEVFVEEVEMFLNHTPCYSFSWRPEWTHFSHHLNLIFVPWFSKFIKRELERSCLSGQAAVLDFLHHVPSIYNCLAYLGQYYIQNSQKPSWTWTQRIKRVSKTWHYFQMTNLQCLLQT